MTPLATKHRRVNLTIKNQQIGKGRTQIRTSIENQTKQRPPGRRGWDPSGGGTYNKGTIKTAEKKAGG